MKKKVALIFQILNIKKKFLKNHTSSKSDKSKQADSSRQVILS
jgi:hypothetical protein